MEGTFFSYLVSYFCSKKNRNTTISNTSPVQSILVEDGIIFKLPEHNVQIPGTSNLYIGKGQACICSSHFVYMGYTTIRTINDIDKLYKDYFLKWMSGVSFGDYFFKKIDNLYWGYFYDEFNTSESEHLTLVQMVLINDFLYVSTILSPKTKNWIRNNFISIFYDQYLFKVIHEEYTIENQLNSNQEDS